MSVVHNTRLEFKALKKAIDGISLSYHAHIIMRQGIFRVQKLLVASFELGSWRVVTKFTATEN